VLVAVVVLLALRGLWWPATDGARYPWSSDTLGHLIKADYLQQEIAAGHWYPNLFPHWYNGVQMMRYYPPLPYYALVGINLLTRDMLMAGHVYIVLAALLGALACLLFARWVGWLPAASGALLFALAPDNLRVALAEGNLPRTLASALLPALTYCLLCVLRGEGRRRHLIAGGLLLTATILSHAMMGAIFGAGLGALAVLLFLLKGSSARSTLDALSVLVVGLLLSGVWLLPSLTGGISSLDQQAVTEALVIFPLTTYLNPVLRFENPEALYLGLALSVAVSLGLLHPAGRRPLPLSLFVIGVGTALISTPGFNDLFNGLPAHQLFWPIRFLSFSALALTLALIFQLPVWLKQRHGTFIVALFALGLMLDVTPSLRLAVRRPEPRDLAAISRELAGSQGWRVATLDFSRLGSAPTYLFTAQGGREQVFGWAYQGARTATNVAALNGALETGAAAYALTALDLLGADDVVVLESDARLAQFAPHLPERGYAEVWIGGGLSLYHREGGPRAIRVIAEVLGIGSGAQNVATLFPSMMLASSPYVDDLDPASLARFRTLVLSRFQWHDQSRAEALVREFAERGGEVVVDLNGAPDDSLAREPRFLDVYGERVRFAGERVTVVGEGVSQDLLPFAEPEWQTVVPQGDLHPALTFDYHGVQGLALGVMPIGSGRVWFVGLNLPYHTARTNDPVGLAMLQRLLKLPARQPAEFVTVPLRNYRADRDGYRFDLTLEAGGDLLIPVADHGGAEIRVDGQPVLNRSLYNLIGVTAPAGQHRIEIVFQPTPVYSVGVIVSLIGATLGGLGLYRWKGGGYEPETLDTESVAARQPEAGLAVGARPAAGD
jgi:uncharacterized membrane protein